MWTCEICEDFINERQSKAALLLDLSESISLTSESVRLCYEGIEGRPLLLWSKTCNDYRCLDCFAILSLANAQALTQLEKERLMAERLAKASKREMYPNLHSSTLGINRISKSFIRSSEFRTLCVWTGHLAEGGSKGKEAWEDTEGSTSPSISFW